MEKIEGNAGLLLVYQHLPEDLRPPPGKELDRREVARIFSELAERYPDRYREISHKILNLAADMAYWSGGGSFSVRHLRRVPEARQLIAELREKIFSIQRDNSLTPRQKYLGIVSIASEYQKKILEATLNRIRDEKNPLYDQISGAGRGNQFTVNALVGSDVIYGDHQGRPVPVIIEKSYGEGVNLMEYLASAYGTRQGVLSSKFAIRRAGFLTKSVQQAVHRLLVSSYDRPPDDPLRSVLGLPVEADDPDNEGAVLARPVGDIPAGTVLTPRHIEEFRRWGIKKIYIRSPLLPGDHLGGLYAVDVGLREGGRFPDRYSLVGLQAAQALLEPVAQGQLNVRHSGGVAGIGASRVVTGFKSLEQLVRAPSQMQHGAVHAEVDGKVDRIEPNPAGGWNVYINGKPHYVPAQASLLVKPGSVVEAGDVLTDGIPSPAVITQYKGIGEGRRYFVKLFRQALENAGHPGHRRNIEIIARGLINHVRLGVNWENWYEGEVIPYDTLVSRYKARDGAVEVPVESAVGKFLEGHYLHYTIGTPVRPSVVRELKEAGIDKVLVHPDPPFFQPVMIGADRALQYDPDWMVRLLGGYQQKSLLEASRLGVYSSLYGTSFVPVRAHAKLLGRVGVIRTPEPWEKGKGVRDRSKSLWQTSLSRSGEGQIPEGRLWEDTGVGDDSERAEKKWK